MPHSWEPKWQFVKKLGKGGQGITQLVISTETPDQQGVLKYLINNKNPVNRARMNREVVSLDSLLAAGAKVPKVIDHNTAQYQDLSVELYMVMEFIDGPTLDAVVKDNGTLSVDDAIDVALQLCDTVKTAHTEGIFHRDIKPDNIIREKASGNVVIVDYGLSFNSVDPDVTETAETFKNKFLSLPETNTAGGDRRDPRSDVTAVCAVFYFMLTGHNPGHLHDSAGKMAHVRPGYTLTDAGIADARRPQIELFLNRGLAYPIQNRFQSIDECIDRLSALQQQPSSTTVSDPLAVAAELRRQFRAMDSKTRVAALQPDANRLLEEFGNKVNVMGKNIEPFTAHIGPGGHDGPPVDASLDKITTTHHCTLSVNQHGEWCGRLYRVASRGEQCVVLASEVRQRSDKPGKMDFSAWREIAWYEGSPNIIDAVENEFKNWIAQRMQEAGAEILGK